jgi:CheY-like chemotaxis protein
VEQIRNTGERAANLTKQLLAFSRKQIMQPKVLDLNAGLMDMEKLLRRLIGEDVNLTVCCAKDLALVKADSGQMEQVVMNLAINARDAMPKGGHLSIETTNVDIASIRVLNHDAAMPPGRYILLTVSDTGTGMDAGTLEHIFEPFFTTKELGRGTGLGLATVYGIVKQSGGFIDVQGEPARGTTFKIFLPVAPAAFLEGEGEGEGEGEKKRHVEKNIYTILLVEDEAAVRCMTRRILNGAGYTVLEAASAREALKHSGEDFDVVLTDIILPDTSGVELVAKLKKDGQIEAIYMSGYTDNPNVRDVLSRPDNRFLQKPFTAEALLSKVREALAQDPNV